MAQPDSKARGAPLPEGTVGLLTNLKEYRTTVPDELTQYYLQKSGSRCSNAFIVRLISLAGQKFLATVINDAQQIAKRRMAVSQQTRKALGYNTKDKRLVLTTEDVAEALREYGVNVRSAPYFVSHQQ